MQQTSCFIWYTQAHTQTCTGTQKCHYSGQTASAQQAQEGAARPTHRAHCMQSRLREFLEKASSWKCAGCASQKPWQLSYTDVSAPEVRRVAHAGPLKLEPSQNHSKDSPVLPGLAAQPALALCTLPAGLAVISPLPYLFLPHPRLIPESSQAPPEY